MKKVNQQNITNIPITRMKPTGDDGKEVGSNSCRYTDGCIESKTMSNRGREGKRNKRKSTGLELFAYLSCVIFRKLPGRDKRCPGYL